MKGEIERSEMAPWSSAYSRDVPRGADGQSVRTCRVIGAISLRSISPHPAALRASTFPRKGGGGSALIHRLCARGKLEPLFLGLQQRALQFGALGRQSDHLRRIARGLARARQRLIDAPQQVLELVHLLLDGDDLLAQRSEVAARLWGFALFRRRRGGFAGARGRGALAEDKSRIIRQIAFEGAHRAVGDQ